MKYSKGTEEHIPPYFNITLRDTHHKSLYYYMTIWTYFYCFLHTYQLYNFASYFSTVAKMGGAILGLVKK